MRARIVVAVCSVLAAGCVTVLGCLILAAGCGRDNSVPSLATGCDTRAFTTTDSWYAPPDGEGRFIDLDRERFAVVTEEHQAIAREMLEGESGKGLTEPECVQLVGKSLPGDGVPVLLRAVVLNEANGAFAVSVRGSEVFVSHDCLGRHPLPMKRKAVVARLPGVPKTVFVSCGMDQ